MYGTHKRMEEYFKKNNYISISKNDFMEMLEYCKRGLITWKTKGRNEDGLTVAQQFECMQLAIEDIECILEKQFNKVVL